MTQAIHIPVYEVIVMAGGRIEAVNVEAADERSARRQAMRACPWADARRHFVGFHVRRLDEDAIAPSTNALTKPLSGTSSPQRERAHQGIGTRAARRSRADDSLDHMSRS
jgi:hypothetical protein